MGSYLTIIATDVEVGQSEQIPMESQSTRIIVKDHFEVVCGIDFGTDGVGLAYSLPSAEQKGDQQTILHKWKKKLATRYIKKKAQILLDIDGKLRVFGEGASNIMEEFQKSQLSDSDDSGKEEKKQKNEYKLIDKLKMSLYDDPRWRDINSVIEDKDELNEVDLSTIVKAKDGTEFKTEKVFIETLKYLKKEATRFIRKDLNKPNIKKDDIQWILTIPAIWSNAAKTKMRRWAMDSGLISGKYMNQLRMVLEPECAALHIQYLIKTGQFKEKLNIINNSTQTAICNSKPKKCSRTKPKLQYVPAANPTDDPEEKYAANDVIELNTGDIYILIDAGGGTVDIVTHEIINDFGVKEIVPAKGGAFGSGVIDEEMIKMLHDLFGQSNVENFAKEDQQSYVQLLANMIWSKCQFSDNQISEYHSIEIPMDFINYMERHVFAVGNNMETYLSGVQNVCGVFGKQLIKLTTDYMMIHKDVWMKLFDKCINRILYYYDTIISDIKMSNGQCKYLFLVGGLAQSKYFQQRMSECAENMKLIIPSTSILSVVQGAARWGIVPNFVLSRKLTKSYGIEIMEPLSNIKKFNLSQEYIDTHQKEMFGITTVVGILNVFAKKGDEIKLHYVFEDRYYRLSDKQRTADVMIYECGNDEIPKSVHDKDVRRMGFFTLQFATDSTEMDIGVEYSFDDTILVVTAKCGDNNKKRIHIKHSI